MNKTEAATTVTAQVVIDAPRAKVWDVLADIGNAHKWSPDVDASHLTTELTSGVGAARACTLFGGAANIVETFTEWEEGRYQAYELTGLEGVGSMNNSFTVEEVDGGTRVTLSMLYTLDGADPAEFKTHVSGIAQNVVEGLKEYVEAI